MKSSDPLIFVIDDDELVRKGLKRLLKLADYESEIFESASDFLSRPPHPGPACVIVDVQMPGLNGLDFQKTLIRRRPGRAAALHYRARQHSDVRASDESGCGRFSAETIQAA